MERKAGRLSTIPPSNRSVFWCRRKRAVFQHTRIQRYDRRKIIIQITVAIFQKVFYGNVPRKNGGVITEKFFWGGFCREATREVLGEHGPQAARSPTAAQRQNRPKSGVLQAMAIVTKLLRAKHKTTMQPFPTVGRGVGIP